MRRQLARLFVAALLVAGPAVRAANAISVDDLVGLRANGIGDEVLVALIQTDGSVFHLSPAEIVDARKRGLSDGVLLAMILTAKVQPASTPEWQAGLDAPDAVEPVAADIEGTRPNVIHVHQTIVQEPADSSVVTVYVPVVVAATSGFAGDRRAGPANRPRNEPAPVYWGFNGARRADSWVPAAELTKTREIPKPADKSPATSADTKKH